MAETMTETVVTPPAMPARRKTRRVKRKAAVPIRTKEPADDFAGLTVADCPLECSVKGCVISGKPYCAHPRKGGLQSSQLNDPAALDRAHRAKSMLAHSAIDRRKS